jgi:hypothetical protein
MSYLCALFPRDGWLALFVFVSASVFSSAQGNDSIIDYSSLENRAQSLSQRLSAHEALLAEITSRPDPIISSPKPARPILSQPFTPAPQTTEPLPQSETMSGGRLPTPRYDRSHASQPNPDVPDSSPSSQWESPEVPLRNDGYYLGITVGNVLPLDGAVQWKTRSGGMASAPMQFDKGYLAGVLLGRDFGFIRVEGEHNVIHYDQKNDSGSASVHPVLFRCIFEKEIGNRIDLRAGIGAGVSLAQLNYDGKVFGGVSFCYDFLLGTGIRLKEALALNFDYRYFLTAASEDFKRIQSNQLTASLQFDL